VYPPNTDDALESWTLTRPCKSFITTLFVAPYEYHQTRTKDVATAQALKQLCIETSTMEKTDEAMADIDRERAVGPEKLQELIDKKVAEKTKGIQKEMRDLRQAINKPGLAKNSQKRGPPSALKTKKQNGKDPKKPATRAPRKDAKAGGSNKDTDNAANGKRKQKQPTKNGSSTKAKSNRTKQSNGKPAPKRN
jgi:hypothetical protein